MSSENIQRVGAVAASHRSSALTGAAPVATLANSVEKALAAALRKIVVLGRHALAYRMRRVAEHHLARLDDRALRDIGLNRSEIGSVVWTGCKERRHRASHD